MSGAAQTVADKPKPKGASAQNGFGATLRRLPVIPTTIILAFIIMSLFGEWLTPASAYDQNLRLRFLPPSWLEGGDTVSEEFLRVIPRQLPLGSRIRAFRKEHDRSR